MRLYLVLYDGIYQGQSWGYNADHAISKFVEADMAVYPQMRINRVRAIPGKQEDR